jgi:hypothetical protein
MLMLLEARGLSLLLLLKRTLFSKLSECSLCSSWITSMGEVEDENMVVSSVVLAVSLWLRDMRFWKPLNFPPLCA